MGTSWISRKGGNLENGGVDLEKGGGVWTPLPAIALALKIYRRVNVVFHQ